MAAQGAEGGVKTLLHGTVSVTNLAGKEASGIKARAPSGGRESQELGYVAVWGMMGSGAVRLVQPCAVKFDGFRRLAAVVKDVTAKRRI